MANLVETIFGGLLLAAGVAVAIVHYVVEGNSTYSYLTLIVAAVLLLAGWTLFDRGAGISRRWGGRDGGGGSDDLPGGGMR
jgi:hypothetical protein